MTFSWILLFVAGLLETAWAIALKVSQGFTRPLPCIVTIVCAAGSMILLGLAAKQLPISTAYAVWTGIGTAGAVLLGWLFLGETLSPARGGFLLLLLIALIGLKCVR